MNAVIIAEAGVNHNGDIDLARRLIDAAAHAGADWVKFQTFKADLLVTAAAQKAAYQQTPDGSAESQLDMLGRLELSGPMHKVLFDYAAEKEIGIFSTAFDTDSIDMLAALGQTLFKVPSGELTNLPYLRYLGELDAKLIVSTGMATLGEIESAMQVLMSAGTGRDNITLLHCSTEYPAPLASVNLRAMATLGAAFGVQTGYSDHTIGIEVPVAAVALGASVVEKHFTLDKKLPGPDHQASLEPDELQAMVQAIRNTELALGSSLKLPTINELANARVARKSIVALEAIKPGDVFNERNLTVKRPGTGLSPMMWDTVIGRTATRQYAKDDLIVL